MVRESKDKPEMLDRNVVGVQGSDTGMIILSTSFSLMSINPAACRILGVLSQPGQIYTLKKLFDATSIDAADKALKKVLNHGTTLEDLALNLLHETGRKIPGRVSAFPLFAENQEIIGLILRFETLSARQASRVTSSKLTYLPRIGYKHLLDDLPKGVFTIDTQWRISSFNKLAEQLTGFKKEKIIGKYCWQVFQSGQCQHECPFSQIFNTGNSNENQEMTIVNQSGMTRKMIVNVAPLKDETGEVIGGIETFTLAPQSMGKTMPFQSLDTFEGMVGNSRGMKEIFNKLSDIAQSRASVLITGESGTGKELVAQAIHNLSKQKERVFQAVNCSALSETLLESELFGHEKGAFTGAEDTKQGRFEIASDGTLFLDEIGEMKPALQVKLLRVLEQKEFERVGGDRPIKMTARVIAATNQDLKIAQGSGQFREDLYYRLRTIPIHIPPLRERIEDIPLLVTYFIKKFNHKYNKQVRLVDPAVLLFFKTYSWPGNVRELERVMEYAFVFVKGPIIFSRYLPENTEFETIRHPKKSSRKMSEQDKILLALDRAGYKRAKAAELLGISRSSLWRKMKTYGLLNQNLTQQR